MNQKILICTVILISCTIMSNYAMKQNPNDNNTPTQNKPSNNLQNSLIKVSNQENQSFVIYRPNPNDPQGPQIPWFFKKPSKNSDGMTRKK